MHYHSKMADPTITGPIIDSNPQRGRGIAGYTIEEVTHPQSPEAASAQISAMHRALLSELNTGEISGMLISNSANIMRSNTNGITVNLYLSNDAGGLAPDGIDTDYMIYDAGMPRYDIEEIEGFISRGKGDPQPAFTMELSVRALSGPNEGNVQVGRSNSRQEVAITFVDERAYNGAIFTLKVHPDGSTDLEYTDPHGKFKIVSSSSSESSESEPDFKVNVLDENGNTKGDEAILDAYEAVRWNYKQASEEEQNAAMVVDGYSTLTVELFMALQRLQTLRNYHVVMLGFTQRQSLDNPGGMNPIVISARK